MNRALIVKELRESAPLAALTAVGAAWVLANLWGVPITPWDSRQATELPFVNDGALYAALGVLGGGFAAMLALKQSAWEEMKGTFRYLLYRPIERRRVVLTKMAVGVAAVMALMGAFILLHAAWAAAPGHHPSPFFWSMTVPAWHIWLVLPLVYLGAMLTGLRPGRWYGSRLLPAAAAGALAFVLGAQPWWWVALAGSAIASLFFAACILHVARVRDF